jgi:hypothetical protein
VLAPLLQFEPPVQIRIWNLCESAPKSVTLVGILIDLGDSAHRMSAPACRGAHAPYGNVMASGDALAKEMSQGQTAQLSAPQHSTTEKQAQFSALFAFSFALVLFSFINTVLSL